MGCLDGSSRTTEEANPHSEPVVHNEVVDLQPKVRKELEIISPSGDFSEEAKMRNFRFRQGMAEH